MKILHIVPSIDLSAGGPSKSVSDLAVNQASLGYKVTIFTSASPDPYLKQSPHPNLSLQFISLNSFRVNLVRFIKKHRFDIFHGHGIWQMPVHHMAQLARKKNIPYVITPRGMLEPWALNTGKWKKKLAMAVYQRNDLSKAACIHATAQMEADNISALGFKNPIAVIPNGIDIKEFPLPEKNEKESKRTLLFLSRIHPKKGIELLVDAWKQVPEVVRQDWQVNIAGNGDAGYIAELQQRINNRNLTEQVKIIGAQFGSAKLKCYQQADLFVLPTYSENFGIVVAESLACGVPVITTKGTPWEDLIFYNAGWWFDVEVNSLTTVLTEALQTTEKERHDMGLNGRELVKTKYSIEGVAQQLIDQYNKILTAVAQ